MSIWIDIKYANLLSVQLEKYKVRQTNPYLANFRCPICGDSKTSKSKARGYIYQKLNALFYKCHNCGVGLSIGNFIKELNSGLFKEYSLERYKEGYSIPSTSKNKVDFTFKPPVFKEKRLLDRLLPRLDSLPDTNEAVQYCLLRKIPKEKFSSLYFIDDVNLIEQIAPSYKDKLIKLTPRLVIPYYDRNDNLIAVTCRSLRNENLRYLNIVIDKTASLIYNIENVDTSKTVYCCEGPIDSMFLSNAIAASSSNLQRVSKHVPKHNLVLIFDNQPRNKEIVKIMKDAAQNSFKMVVWPENIQQKDINEIICSGTSPEKVLDVINNNTFSDLSLKLKLNSWSKC